MKSAAAALVFFFLLGTEVLLVGAAATGFPYSEYFLKRERANSQSDKPQDLIAASTCGPYVIGSGDIADNQAIAGALVMAIQGAARVVVPMRDT